MKKNRTRPNPEEGEIITTHGEKYEVIKRLSYTPTIKPKPWKNWRRDAPIGIILKKLGGEEEQRALLWDSGKIQLLKGQQQ